MIDWEMVFSRDWEPDLLVVILVRRRKIRDLIPCKTRVDTRPTPLSRVGRRTLGDSGSEVLLQGHA